MNFQELQELRREKWHTNGQPVRTGEAARAFLDSVGFCPMYAPQKPLLMPTFVGAFAGTDENLPTWKQACADPRTQDATELMVRLLRERSAYEANVLGEEENNFLISASAFPYFYGLIGDRTPRTMPQPGTRSEYSPLARDVFDALKKYGPLSKHKLSERLGGSLSDSALDRALNDLWSRLRITRVDYRAQEGTFWDVLRRWSPELVRQGVNMSLPAALSALVAKYVDAVIAADAADVEQFFGQFVGRPKIKDAINALLTSHELTMAHIGNRSMLTVTARQRAAESLARKRSQPIARRPRPGVRTT
jgi:Winged helix DNA-binding domain